MGNLQKTHPFLAKSLGKAERLRDPVREPQKRGRNGKSDGKEAAESGAYGGIPAEGLAAALWEAQADQYEA